MSKNLKRRFLFVNRCSRKQCICSRATPERGKSYSIFSKMVRSKSLFRIEEHVDELRKLLHKYRGVSMSLADACVVRMAEIYEHHAVFTLDSNFSVYRKHRDPSSIVSPCKA